MSRMTPNNARRVESVQWLPAERLGQFNVDATLRAWLIGKGLITLRMRAACGERFGLRQVEQWTGLLEGALQAALRVADHAGLFREVELCCARSGLGVCTDRHSGLHTVRASMACRARRCLAQRDAARAFRRRAQLLRVRVAAGRGALERAGAARGGSRALGRVGSALANSAARRAAAGAGSVFARHGPLLRAVRACSCRAPASNLRRSSLSAGDGSLTGCAFTRGPPTSCPKSWAPCRTILQLTRLDRPIGIWLLLWPTLWAVWIAGRGKPQAASVRHFRRRNGAHAIGRLRDQRLRGSQLRSACQTHQGSPAGRRPNIHRRGADPVRRTVLGGAGAGAAVEQIHPAAGGARRLSRGELPIRQAFPVRAAALPGADLRLGNPDGVRGAARARAARGAVCC